MLSRSVLCLSLVSFCLQAAFTPTTSFDLDNGMKVIVKEYHRDPVAVVQIWYKVGSSYEPAGMTGISHVLEHMMFKGSQALAAGDFTNRIHQVGGRFKSFTGDDYTAYYEVVAKDRVPLVMAMEAERMVGLSLPRSEFKTVISVVREERRLRIEDYPIAMLEERFMTLAFPASSYRNAVAGWQCDLDNMKVRDLERWYRRWYQPKNAILVVVGDVDPEEIQTQARHWFGRLLQECTVPAKLMPSLSEPGKRQLDITGARTELPAMIMGFNVPALATTKTEWECWALQVLVGILDGGVSARLESSLVRGAEIASSISASYNAFSRGDTLLQIVGRPSVGCNKTLADLESGVLEQIDKLKQSPPLQEEMERVRRQLVARLVFERDSIVSQATRLGQLESVGLPWVLAEEEVTRLQEVTPAQVQSVAQRYLIPARMSIARLHPAEGEQL